MPSKPGLKVCLVIDDGFDNLDGVQRYMLDVGEWLRARGHEVHYLAGQTSRQGITNLSSLAKNAKVSFNGNKLSIPLPTSSRKLKQYLDEHNFDVLHIQTPHSPFMSQRLIMAANEKTAVVGTFHILPYGKLSAMGNRLLGLWLRSSLKRFDEIVSVSSAAAEFAEKSFGIETTVLPNVIDYQSFHKAKPLPKYSDNMLTVLFLGRLVPRKGCRLLLEAVSQLKDQDLPPFRVVICGKGPLEANLKQYVDRNGLSDIVEFAGFVSEEDKPRYYASADIAVFPSSGGESFGIVLLEAMASGHSAVLAGDNPGYRSVMARNELLFDPNNAAELADKLRKYLTDNGQRQDMADWGRQYSAGFDVNIVGKEIVEIYRRALRKRSRL